MPNPYEGYLITSRTTYIINSTYKPGPPVVVGEVGTPNDPFFIACVITASQQGNISNVGLQPWPEIMPQLLPCGYG